MDKRKKKRKGDAVEVAYSVMRDVIALADKTPIPPKKSGKRTRKPSR